VDYFKETRSTVVLSALNWPGAAFAISHCGLTPVFVDVDLKTGCIDDDRAFNALSENSNPILLVTHLFGNVALLPKTRRQCGVKKGPMIDDLAQAAGVARYFGGTDLSYTSAIAFSGNGAKHFGAGELGAYCSDNEALIEHFDTVSLSSSSRNGERIFSPLTQGYNYRPNVFSAAIALSRMQRLDDQLSQRQANVCYLWERLKDLPGLLPLFEPNETRNAFCSMPLRLHVDTLGSGPTTACIRDALVDLLRAEGVPASVWLKKPVWEYHPSWRGKWSLSPFPATRRLLDGMFHLTEIAPPNSCRAMDLYAKAFEKVWGLLPQITAWVAETAEQ
jgi:dTDP-4-amino-4,6-dideoxygalactose transaminase